MENIAKAKIINLRVTPRKARLVVNLIRNLSVTEALSILDNTNKSSSRDLYKLVYSAASNAKNNFKMIEEKLYIKEIQVSDGPNRWSLRNYRAKGGIDSFLKRTSNVYVTIGERG